NSTDNVEDKAEGVLNKNKVRVIQSTTTQMNESICTHADNNEQQQGINLSSAILQPHEPPSKLTIRRIGYPSTRLPICTSARLPVRPTNQPAAALLCLEGTFRNLIFVSIEFEEGVA
ncbi:unnamed protein product, partial [Ceratitis capitata]